MNSTRKRRRYRLSCWLAVMGYILPTAQLDNRRHTQLCEPSLSAAREGHAAGQLSDGQIAIIGGQGEGSPYTSAMASAELCRL